MPPPLILWPSTTFGFGSWMRSSKKNSASRCGARMVHPEASRHFNDILLRVAAIHAKRVQFHQLAAVIFIESARLDPPLILLSLFWIVWLPVRKLIGIPVRQRKAASCAKPAEWPVETPIRTP